MARHVGTGALTEQETDGLDDRHHGEHHAHGCRRLGVDEPHEIGVHQVVDARDKHADDGGNSHRRNHTPHGRRGQERIVVLLAHQGLHLSFGAAKVQFFAELPMTSFSKNNDPSSSTAVVARHKTARNTMNENLLETIVFCACFYHFWQVEGIVFFSLAFYLITLLNFFFTFRSNCLV